MGQYVNCRETNDGQIGYRDTYIFCVNVCFYVAAELASKNQIGPSEQRNKINTITTDEVRRWNMDHNKWNKVVV